MVRENIPVRQDDATIRKNWNETHGSVTAQSPDISNFVDKTIMMVLISANVNPSEAQMNQFETDIEAIAGVHQAMVIGKGPVPTGDFAALPTPENGSWELRAQLIGSFEIEKSGT